MNWTQNLIKCIVIMMKVNDWTCNYTYDDMWLDRCMLHLKDERIDYITDFHFQESNRITKSDHFIAIDCKYHA